jgi:DNA invertase Pin-like site-specific DNA recombinase
MNNLKDMSVYDIIGYETEHNISNVLSIGYARISKEDDSSQTLQSQSQTIIETAKREDNILLKWSDVWSMIKNPKIKVVLEKEKIAQSDYAIFIDRKSGKSFNRLFFNELSEIIKEWNGLNDKKIGVCYVRDYDRLGRPEKDYESSQQIYYFENVLKCKLWSCTEARNEFIRQILMAVATQERKKTTRKIQEGKMRSFQEGRYFGQMPLGIDKKNYYNDYGKLLKQELYYVTEESEFIKKLFNELDAGINVHQIYIKYKEEGKFLLQKKNDKMGKRANATFSYPYLVKIFSNTIYIGYAKYSLPENPKLKCVYYKINLIPLIEPEIFFKYNKGIDKEIENKVFNP